MSLLIANLDAEVEMAGGIARDLSPAAAAMAATCGSLMRGLAEEGDVIWTAAPLDAARLPSIEGLPTPRWRHGPLHDPGAEVVGLAWAETASVARLRERAERAGAAEQPVATNAGTVQPWWRTVRALEPAAPELVARLHHRAFHLDLARRLGLALSGARLVESVEDWRGHLEHGGAAASPRGRWVLKAGWSAAGRSRLVGSSAPDAADGVDARAREVERLLSRHGPAVCEPWLDRVDDLGALGLVGPDGVEHLGVHRQLVSGGRGRFAGLSLSLGAPLQPPNDADVSHDAFAGAVGRLEEVLVQVGEALGEAGYRGPFGIDAYLHRLSDGTLAFHPFGELNVRFTMGHLTRALAERLHAARGGAPGTVATLRLGALDPSAADAGPAPSGKTAIGHERLLAPGPAGEPGAELLVTPAW